MKTLATLSAISIALLTNSQAYALSCASTGFDLEASFKANKAADQNVVYVLGSFSRKQNKKAKAGSGEVSIIQSPKESTFNLMFSGKIITKNGTKPFKQKVKVTTSCVASWCGKVPKSSQKIIAALTKTTSGYTMNAGPCGPNTFSNQVNTDWKRLEKLIH